jgi:hypothetical protein
MLPYFTLATAFMSFMRQCAKGSKLQLPFLKPLMHYCHASLQLGHNAWTRLLYFDYLKCFWLPENWALNYRCCSGNGSMRFHCLHMISYFIRCLEYKIRDDWYRNDDIATYLVSHSLYQPNSFTCVFTLKRCYRYRTHKRCHSTSVTSRLSSAFAPTTIFLASFIEMARAAGSTFSERYFIYDSSCTAKYRYARSASLRHFNFRLMLEAIHFTSR